MCLETSVSCMLSHMSPLLASLLKLSSLACKISINVMFHIYWLLAIYSQYVVLVFRTVLIFATVICAFLQTVNVMLVEECLILQFFACNSENVSRKTKSKPSFFSNLVMAY